MKTRVLTGLLTTALVLGVTSCGGNDPVFFTNTSPFMNLTQKDHVLLNLKTAYTEMNHDEVDRMLADEFVFHFSPSDVRDGNVAVPSWDRVSELTATAHLFHQVPIPTPQKTSAAQVETVTWGVIKSLYAEPDPMVESVTKISVSLNFPEGDTAWVDVTPEVGAVASGQQYFQKTFAYVLVVTAGSTTFTNSSPIDATVRVRSIQVGGQTEWRIVAWFDDTAAPPPPPTPAAKDDVLFNLRAAYTLRDLAQYDRLLDDGFTFFFSAQDVSDGNVPVAQWGRASDSLATAHIFANTLPATERSTARGPQVEETTWGRVKGLYFDPMNAPANLQPVQNISLQLNFPSGEDSWVPQIDDNVHPGEIWYEKTVSYFLVVVAGETTFTSPQDVNASFVIRFTEADGDSIYRIVSWRDDI